MRNRYEPVNEKTGAERVTRERGDCVSLLSGEQRLGDAIVEWRNEA